VTFKVPAQFVSIDFKMCWLWRIIKVVCLECVTTGKCTGSLVNIGIVLFVSEFTNWLIMLMNFPVYMINE
jgi:hypothetical protein